MQRRAAEEEPSGHAAMNFVISFVAGAVICTLLYSLVRHTRIYCSGPEKFSRLVVLVPLAMLATVGYLFGNGRGGLFGLVFSVFAHRRIVKRPKVQLYPSNSSSSLSESSEDEKWIARVNYAENQAQQGRTYNHNSGQWE